ncbi:hypothetical protein BATR1942_07775 [Bacillus atrophaeus 1942]|uniref:Uncharacterized protein n=1 Tax=Bacillus atrophaeus (strain 1942) TaxID=720555 RepID=A0ABM5LXG5_BACA1|nr:hypothetical protein BATR1942_07775 [Bacillus atrophaeus 1942]EIM11708.1 hypothetical protein UY9_05587 [Bacillus atrophaeus C89]
MKNDSYFEDREIVFGNEGNIVRQEVINKNLKN